MICVVVRRATVSVLKCRIGLLFDINHSYFCEVPFTTCVLTYFTLKLFCGLVFNLSIRKIIRAKSKIGDTTTHYYLAILQTLTYSPLQVY